jgi:glycosyltransferase involved in cell wall biosynthesis
MVSPGSSDTNIFCFTIIPNHFKALKYSPYHLDIVQPCYNPLPGWEHSVWQHYSELKAMMPGVNINLIIINDGSVRNITPEQIAFLYQHIPGFQFVGYEHNKGKGYALRKGICLAQSDTIIYTDIDFPFELRHIPEIYTLLRSGADVVSGVRVKNYYVSLSPMRFVASRTSQLLNRIFLKLPFNDTQSGIKGMNGKGKELFLRTKIDRYLADTEFLALSARKKLNIIPHKVNLRDDIHLSKMGFKTFMRELSNFIRIYTIIFKPVK